MSLYRLWRRQERRADARQTLESVFCTFTEGFGTPDLVTAKAMLDSD
jgi:predicted ATPase